MRFWMAPVAALLFLASPGFARDSKPLRLALVAGAPVGLALGVEYAPSWEGLRLQLALEIHGSYIPSGVVSGNEADLSFAGVGASLISYFTPRRDKLFVAIGYDWNRLDGAVREESEERYDPIPYEVEADLDLSYAHASVGWRWLFRALTLTAEAGWGVAWFDGELPATMSAGGKSIREDLDLDWNGSSGFGHGLTARIGAGVAL